MSLLYLEKEEAPEGTRKAGATRPDISQVLTLGSTFIVLDSAYWGHYSRPVFYNSASQKEPAWNHAITQ